MTRDEQIAAIQHHLARKHRIWPANRHWIHAEFLLCMYEERPPGTSKRPPWQHGRHKTRGGRDQDRRRKIEALIRFRKLMKPKLFVNGLEIECESIDIRWNDTKKSTSDSGCVYPCHSFEATLTLNDNPYCDFVKGGE